MIATSTLLSHIKYFEVDLKFSISLRFLKHLNKWLDGISCIFGNVVDLVTYLDKSNSVFLNSKVVILFLSISINFPLFKIK